MRHHKRAGFRFPSGPDILAEELAKLLSKGVTLDVHAMFERILPALQSRGSGKQGKDTLRLSLYDKLTNFVAEGLARKEGKVYSGEKKALAEFLKEAKAAEEERQARRQKAAERFDGSEAAKVRQP